MAKKSSKSSRHQRTKKKEVAKKKPTTKKVATAAVITEGSDEPVVEQETSTQKKRTNTKKAERPIEAAVEAEAVKLSHESVEEIIQPTRSRMIMSVVALSIIVVALIFGAAIVRQGADKQSDQMVKSGEVSGKADEIIRSGGNVCTNGDSQTDTTGSSNPQSVGMILQTNPANNIQTPQTLSSGNDANSLQGASCF